VRITTDYTNNMVTSKCSKKSSTAKGTKGWKSNSKDGKLLKKLLLKGKIGPGMPPGAIKEQWKQFGKYKNDAFSSAVRRLKASLGINCRKAPGDNSGKLIQVGRSVGRSVHFAAVD